VLAEGVASEAELATLSAVGFDGATGPGVKVAAA
jgi:EAL domain-containing protein (putative c-di-GMP-specific phosphodiesterase class I)